jgi:hypothetical protein
VDAPRDLQANFSVAIASSAPAPCAENGVATVRPRSADTHHTFNLARRAHTAYSILLAEDSAMETVEKDRAQLAASDAEDDHVRDD